MIGLELRLRQRIDVLSERCHGLELALERAHAAEERAIARAATYRHRAKDMQRSRDLWRGRVHHATRVTLEAVERRKARRAA